MTTVSELDHQCQLVREDVDDENAMVAHSFVLIPSLLSEILSHLPQPQLKEFRTVSLQWAEEGWKLLRKNAVIFITELKHLEEIHEYFLRKKNNICVNMRFQGFSWTLVQSPTFISFTADYSHMIKYLHFDQFSTNVGNECELQCKLLNMFPALEELVLSFREPDFSSLLPTTNVDLVKHSDIFSYHLRLENLKVLRLRRIFRKKDGDFVMKILQSAPNVKTISISTNSGHTDGLESMSQSSSNFSRAMLLGAANEDFMIPNFQDFRARRRNGNFETYNELLSHYFLSPKCLSLHRVLHLNFHLLITSDKQLQALKSRQCIALRTLHLVLCANLNITEIRSLISSFSETLESFYLSLNSTDDADYSQSSPYNQIWDTTVEWKKLNLLSLRNIQSFKISLTETMPQLKTLLLHECNFPNLMMTKSIMKDNYKSSNDHIDHHNKMQSLIVHRDKSKRLTLQILMNINKLFPSLTKLKLENLSDSGLRVIFSSLKLLEDFYLMSDQITDSGITGLRSEVCRKLLKTKEHPNSKSYSCIGDLKKLYKLEIASSKISDLSILHGIAECQSLRKLFLYSPKISSKSVRKIIDDMNLCDLEIEFCQQLPDTVIQYAKKNISNSFCIRINKQNPRSTSQIMEYFRTRGSTFHLRG